MGVFEQVTTMGHEQVLFCNDKSSGLKAIIAIHDTTLGPALGGCRMWDYESEEAALFDVLRLSRGMTYKAAISDLNLGGGKAVIIGDPTKLKSEALFKTFGRFINSLGGRYITAEDVNIKVSDMEMAATETRYVTGLTSRPGGSGDPSPVTAFGVYQGIRAAVKHKLGKSTLSGLSIAVQGCGAVGTYLIELLAKDGVKIYASDIDEKKVRSVVEKYKAEPVDLAKVHALPVDVFSPCALGGILNDKSIPELKTPIVAGGANNQLLDEAVHAKALKDKGILYSPDYVINAGGLINVYQELKGYNAEAARQKAANIYNTLAEVFKKADETGVTTIKASNEIAERRLDSVRKMSHLRNSMDNQIWVAPR